MEILDSLRNKQKLTSYFSEEQSKENIKGLEKKQEIDLMHHNKKKRGI